MSAPRRSNCVQLVLIAVGAASLPRRTLGLGTISCSRWATILVILALLVCAQGCSTRAQRLYRRAEAFFAQGQYQLAAIEYSRILKESPDDPLADDALYKLAYLYREELDNPGAALQSYRYLVDTYANSSYVDDALLWMVYITRRRLQDPDMVVATCREIDERFAKDMGLRSLAWLQAAGAYYDAGQIDKARQRCAAIIGQFGSEHSVAAEACLLLANITRDKSANSQEALALYERVIKQYPGTPAAGKARQVLGYHYYHVKTKEDEERRAQLQRQAQVLKTVPPIAPYPRSPGVELLAAMQSLLQQAGAQVSLDELMVISGLAFSFCFDVDKPQALEWFYRNPLTLLAEEMGVGCNLWTFEEMGQALAAVTTTLHNNRPLLISYGRPQARTALITGYKPAEKKIYLALPGDNNVVVTEEAFRQQWQSVKVQMLWSPQLEAGYQFSLTTRKRQPSAKATIKSAVLRAALTSDQAQLMSVPAGRAGYQAFCDYIRHCLPAEAGASRTKLQQWAKQAVPRLTAARGAAARHLGPSRSAVSGPEQVALTAASESYERLVQRWQRLGERIKVASSQPASPRSLSSETAEGEEIWVQILQDAEAITQQEQQTLQDLAAALGS